MKKTAFILMILTILVKFFGLIRDIILSYFYGASNISDAYLISTTIPTVIFAFIGTGIATSYIPMYSNIESELGTKLSDEFTNNIINFAGIICISLALGVILFTNPIVKLFASGFEEETLELAVKLTRISIFSIYFISIIYVFSGYLQLKNNFIIPAAMGIPLNLVIIISIIISAKTDNVLILSIGTLIAMVSQMVFLLPSVYKKGFRFKIILNIYDHHLKKMICLSVPVIAGISVNQINILIDRTIASQIATGGISALTYANRLNLFIQGIFVMSLATAMYPIISKMVAENNIEGLKKSLAEVVRAINILVLPPTIGAMIFSEPIIMMLFGRGVFNTQAILLTSSALFFYSIGMIGFGLREVLSRAFYSMQDTKTPMLNAAIGMVLNIILNIILSRYLGIGGLALATSIAAIFTTGLMFISLRKKIGPFGMKKTSISFLKVLFASLSMGSIAKLSFNYLTSVISQNLSLLLTIIIGAISYFIIISFMKIEDVDLIINMVKKKLDKLA